MRGRQRVWSVRGAALLCAVGLVGLGGCSGPAPVRGSASTPVPAGTHSASLQRATRSYGPATPAPLAPAASATPSPAGGSVVGQAYLAAVDAAMPAWKAVDARMSADNGVVYRDELLAEIDADATFLTALRAITFPTAALPAATAFIQAVKDYDSFLTDRYNNFGTYSWYLDKDEALKQIRADRSAHLREVLGLPPSTVTLIRP